jgi:hypothetical protein
VAVESGPSQLWLFNEASRIMGNLAVLNSSGVRTGYDVGTSFGDNPGWGGPSQIDGNFTYTASGALYIGSPLHANGNFNASGNSVTDGGNFAIADRAWHNSGVALRDRHRPEFAPRT